VFADEPEGLQGVRAKLPMSSYLAHVVPKASKDINLQLHLTTYSSP